MSTLQARFEPHGVITVETVRPCPAGERMERDKVFAFRALAEIDAFVAQLTAARSELTVYERRVKQSDLQRLRASVAQHDAIASEERQRIAQLEAELEQETVNDATTA